MVRDLSLLIRRIGTPDGAPRPAVIAQIREESAILDRSVAQRLGKAPMPRASIVSEQDVRDALMTFALVFTGAMVFLM